VPRENAKLRSEEIRIGFALLAPGCEAYVHLVLVFCAQTIPCEEKKKKKKSVSNYLKRANFQRPLFLLFFKTFLPVLEAILARNPEVLITFLRVPFKVCFVILFYI
jgi:hypothetical protein